MSGRHRKVSGAPYDMEINVEQVKALIELMVTNELTRIEITEGDGHLLLRRGQAVVASPSLAMPQYLAPAAAAPAPAAPPAPSAPPPPATPSEKEILIRSPMVGTFYASPEPEAPPFVNVGSTVNANTVVCLVEAMKVFNEIKAETSGRITKVLAKSGQAVEFDQPLFAVTPT